MPATKRPHLRRLAHTNNGRPRLVPPLLFIGDLHGNVHFLESLLAGFPHHTKIFLGDFLDSRQFTRDDEIKTLEIVLDLIEQGEARSCFGNHEWSYLEPAMRCSGYEQAFDIRLKPYKDRMRRLLETFFWLPEQKILVTHAGITHKLWQECKFSVERLPRILTDWSMLPVTETPAGWIGVPRGGSDLVGGTYWCDWYGEFEPVPGIIQILGHTSSLAIHEQLVKETQGIRRRGSNYNIDCLTRTWEVLELKKDGTLRTIGVKEIEVTPPEPQR